MILINIVSGVIVCKKTLVGGIYDIQWSPEDLFVLVSNNVEENCRIVFQIRDDCAVEKRHTSFIEDCAVNDFGDVWGKPFIGKTLDVVRNGWNMETKVAHGKWSQTGRFVLSKSNVVTVCYDMRTSFQSQELPGCNEAIFSKDDSVLVCNGKDGLSIYTLDSQSKWILASRIVHTNEFILLDVCSEFLVGVSNSKESSEKTFFKYSIQSPFQLLKEETVLFRSAVRSGELCHDGSMLLVHFLARLSTVMDMTTFYQVCGEEDMSWIPGTRCFKQETTEPTFLVLNCVGEMVLSPCDKICQAVLPALDDLFRTKFAGKL
jgi:hypothetical protein